MGEPKTIKAKEIPNHLGMAVIARRGDNKEAVRIIRAFDEDGVKKAEYELLSGPGKGEKWTGRYDPEANVVVYDDDSMVLALLGT